MKIKKISHLEIDRGIGGSEAIEKMYNKHTVIHIIMKKILKNIIYVNNLLINANRASDVYW